MFTDTHCHLFKEDYPDLEAEIKDVFNLQVKRIIISGFDLNSNKEALKIAETNSNIYVTLGQHPCNLENWLENVEFIENNINNFKVVGVGEIGLDNHFDNAKKKEQEKVFIRMIKLAEKYKKPLIIHTREAFKETLNLLKKINQPVIIHSFSTSLEEARSYIAAGFYLGINGILTFKNSSLSNILPFIPLNKILLETDSPYLAPVPLRGSKNTPQNILLIAKEVSKIYNISLEKLSQQLEINLNAVFDIKYKI